ncbi:MAG TPA: EH signature domain-containing protein [Patescibacteria group bacterium]|nr:EH signature domain-containing protein [Patescibacteria group bacterium]
MDVLYPRLQQAVAFLQEPACKFGRPAQLEEQAQRMNRKLQPLTGTPRERDLERLFRRVRRVLETEGRAGLQVLKVREIKGLPWLLHYDPVREYIRQQPDFLAELLFQIEYHQQLALRPFIHAYLLGYQPRSPIHTAVRSRLETLLAAYSGDRPSLIKWHSRLRTLFAADGVDATAQRLVNHSEPVPEQLAGLGLVNKLASCRFLQEAAFLAGDALLRGYPRGLERLAGLLEKPAYGYAGEFVDRFPGEPAAAARRFISRAGVKAPAAEREILLPLFLRRLGDPGLPACQPHWEEIGAETTGIFRTWVKEKDAELFFGTVARGAREDRTWQYRRAFWLAFLPNVSRTWLALTPRTYDELPAASVRDYLRDRGHSRLNGAATEPGQGIFLAQIRDYVFADWASRRSLAVWKADQIKFGQASYLLQRFSHLKPLEEWDLYETRSDSYLWQRRVETWIYRHTGISRSFTYEVGGVRDPWGGRSER